MISIEPVTVVVRTGGAGRYADWPIAPELLRRGVPPATAAPRAGREGDLRRLPGPPCTVHALAHRELHGVWGGLSEADRRPRLAHP
ncbi:WhiB family transcriptional regulator [Pseudonocardia yunnanensis]|uniref:WhiB family transcriptional regulator n=1 Tax=Pseudonocardia yunnanensis TaxID=58107 RepID=A0ABW4F654_9PSEU